MNRPPRTKDGTASHKSCFKPIESILNAGKVAFTIDLGKTFFVAAVLLVEHLSN